MTQVWGCSTMSDRAARALDDKSHHHQVRCCVLAKSRAAAGRYMAAAGLFYDAGQATRHLATYGSPSANPAEVAACQVEGQVYVSSMNRWDGPLIPWPPSD